MAKIYGVAELLGTTGTSSFTFDASGNLVFSPTTFSIVANTGDTSDNKALLLGGGGIATNSRGANLGLYGNEHATLPGEIQLVSGDIPGSSVVIAASNTNGSIHFNVNGGTKWRIDTGGNFTPPTDNANTIGSTSLQASAIYSRILGSLATLIIRTQNANDIELQTSNTTRWKLKSGGDLEPGSSGSYSIGTTSIPVRFGYFGDNSSQGVKLGWSISDSASILNTLAASALHFQINAVSKLKLLSTGDLQFTNGSFNLTSDTSDGSDNKRILISGGGDISQNRGAFLQLTGNEHGETGQVKLYAGNIAGGDIHIESNSGKIELYIGGTERLRLHTDGKVGISHNSPTFWLDVKGSNDNATARLSVSAAGSTTLRFDTFDDPAQTANNKNWAFRNRYNDFGLFELMRSTTSTGDPLTTVMSWNKNSDVYLHGGALRFHSGSANAIYFGSTGNLIATSTIDGSDNARIYISGGGGQGTSRGAEIIIDGNEAPDSGRLLLSCGNVGGAELQIRTFGAQSIGFYTNNTGRWYIDSSGHLIPSANNSYDIGSSASPNKVNSIWVNNVRGVNNDMVIGPTTGHAIFFRTADTNRFSLGGSGHLIPESDNTYNIGSSSSRLLGIYSRTTNVENTNAGDNISSIFATHASYAGIMHQLWPTRAASTGFSFGAYYSNNGGDLEFHFRGDGNGFCDGSFSGGGADYAEYFETSDSETISVGKVVVLDGITGKVREYDSQTDQTSDIFGVVRPKQGGSSTVGNLPQKWHHKYLRDDFGSYILDQNGERQLNPQFDPEEEYVSREDRAEWVLIGLTGQIPVLLNETKNPSWKKMKDISASVELYLIK